MDTDMRQENYLIRERVGNGYATTDCKVLSSVSHASQRSLVDFCVSMTVYGVCESYA